jgi:hypothetical protein
VTHSDLSGTFEVTIDIDSIVRVLAGRAAKNSTGKAGTFGGRIKAKKLFQQTERTRVSVHPIPEQFEEVVLVGIPASQ